MSQNKMNAPRDRQARPIAAIREWKGSAFVEGGEPRRVSARAGFALRPAAFHTVSGMVWLGIALGVFARVLRESWIRQAWLPSRENGMPAPLFSALETTCYDTPEVFFAGGICLLLAFFSSGAGFMAWCRRHTRAARMRIAARQYPGGKIACRVRPPRGQSSRQIHCRAAVNLPPEGGRLDDHGGIMGAAFCCHEVCQGGSDGEREFPRVTSVGARRVLPYAAPARPTLVRNNTHRITSARNSKLAGGWPI